MSVPVISVAQMRQWEQASWEAGRSQAEVISRAGRATAGVALKLTRRGDRILILAGKGHNGDDARCAQPFLAKRSVTLMNVSDPQRAVAEVEAFLEQRPALVIDGLFGIGLNRPLNTEWADLIELVNRASVCILAVDIPSGLNADTGEPQNVAVCAQATVTFGAPKRGMLNPKSYAFVGRMEVASEIGLAPCPFTNEELQWTVAEDFSGFPPSRRVDGHKGTFGHVAILAGSEGYHGAAVLAARGALRARPGLVSVFCAPNVYPAVASQCQAAMVHPFRKAPLPHSCTSLVIGPGLAANDLDSSWKEYVNEQWQSFPMPVLVDASALDWIQQGPTPLNSRRVLTPHPGEAARLLQTKTNVIHEDRVVALREISNRFGNCWVVLKGHQTLIGRSSGEIFVNCSGNPFLAQGGSGDVLAGFLGGLLAQPRMQAQPLKTLRYGIWSHGATADRLAARGRVWTVEELMAELGNVSPDSGG